MLFRSDAPAVSRDRFLLASSQAPSPQQCLKRFFQVVKYAKSMDEVLPYFCTSERRSLSEKQAAWSPAEDERKRKFFKNDYFGGKPYEKELEKLKKVANNVQQIEKVTYPKTNEAHISVVTKGSKVTFMMVNENSYWRYLGWRRTHIRIR